MPRRLVAALLASSLLGACAYSLSGPAPNRARNEPPECDTSKSFVVIDGLMATALGVAALSLASSEEPAVALLPISIGAIYLGGALKGNTVVNQCRAAMSEYGGVEDARQARDTLSTMDAHADAGAPARRPSDVVPPLPYQPTPYPGQAAYSPTSSPSPHVPYASPAPIAAPPAATPPVQAPPRKAPAAADDWSDFWREVP
jgi:hypothetical protein